ncbi:MAG: hypothetical protein KKB81_07680 [Candidatus Margulisbacteria bacterium]|nr:hypothetical protein [Candidatus Margulisiibacteriota bacterium]MBU1021228.1 hypothetical protein [Candidatus Margulisiibacteriota bacterium]MBU1729834.1 hypothetical protein [Candidatus Margulisiibacteriota bacterium]MBU1955335.1 hypothetical protein [Candidatus Margulisiibacteriota bacterium]
MSKIVRRGIKIADSYLMTHAKRHADFKHLAEAALARKAGQAIRDPLRLQDIRLGNPLIFQSEHFPYETRVRQNKPQSIRWNKITTETLRGNVYIEIAILPVQATSYRVTSALAQDENMGNQFSCVGQHQTLVNLGAPHRYARAIRDFSPQNDPVKIREFLPLTNTEAAVGIWQLCGQALQSEFGLTHFVITNTLPLYLIKTPTESDYDLRVFDLARPGSRPLRPSSFGDTRLPENTGIVFWNFVVECAEVETTNIETTDSLDFSIG